MHKGDPLVQLDDRDYRAAVGARPRRAQPSARADLALADADLQRGRDAARAAA